MLKKSRPKTSRTRKRVKVRNDGSGRSDGYRPEYDLMVTKLPPPITNSQICYFLDIAIQTLHNWREKYPSFKEAIQKAKDKVDDDMENAFYRRGLGYEHPADKIFPPRRGEKKPLVVPYVERYPPDTAACISWLKNRRPATWREHPELADEETPPAATVVIEFKDAKRKER